MAYVGETDTYTFSPTFSEMGLVTVGTQLTAAGIRNYLGENLEKKLTAAGFKLIKGFNMALWLLDTVAFAGSALGYTGLNFTVHMEYVELTKHQAGQVFTIEGWRPQYLTISLY